MRILQSTLRAMSIPMLAAVLVATAAPSSPAAESSELRCRRAIVGALDRWVFDASRVHQRCHSMIVNGLLPPSTDCVAGSLVRQSLLAAEGAVHAALDRACAGTNWGLLSFPGPCADGSDVFGPGRLSDCIDTRGRSAFSDLLAVWYPDGLRPTRGAESACVQTVPKRASMMVTRELRARLACQLGVEEGRIAANTDCRAEFPPYGSGTGDPAVDRKILRARDFWLRGLPRACASTDFSALDYGSSCPGPVLGAGGLADLQSCVYGSNRRQVPLLLDLAFPSASVCGNGIPQEGEACDNGAANSDTKADACRTDCTLPICGDRTTDPGNNESCDDGNFVDLDGCTANCRLEFCGDGVTNNGSAESCDDGNTNPNDRCTNSCRDAVCGDGVVCDAAACTSGPAGGVEQCDLGAQNSPSGLCRPDCSGYRRTCTVTVGITNSVRLGALTYELGYSGLAGDFLGSGGTVQCTSLVTGGLVSFFDNESTKRVKESLIVDAGVQTPASIASCVWATNASSVPTGAFSISVQVAADPAFDPVPATVAVTSVQCQP
jgi:cysteine-rich repeat protein